MEHVVDFVQMQRFDDPLLVEILHAMRTPGGKKVSEKAWQTLVGTVLVAGSATQPATAATSSGALQPANDARPAVDPRLLEARGWYECAYEWRIVSYAMHANARLNAKAAGKPLFYIPAVDSPACRMGRADYDDMRAFPNISTTAKLMGILPAYIGMDVILADSYLPPKVVRGAVAEIVGIEFHAQEPLLHGRASLASSGCAILSFMPKCIYVRVRNCTDFFLTTSANASQLGIVNLQGVIAALSVSRPWKFKTKTMTDALSVVRTQCPLLPQKQCTLHGIQGKTADPGFIAHWKFPKGLSKESVWLAYYVSLSRPRSLSRLLCHGVPDRDVIEGGPPETIVKAFVEFFDSKIAATKLAGARTRAELG